MNSTFYTDRGRTTTAHDRTDGQRTDDDDDGADRGRTDGRTEDDDGHDWVNTTGRTHGRTEDDDGHDWTDTTGRTDTIYSAKVSKTTSGPIF